MTDKQLLEIAIQNQKNLEKRVIELEEQMALLMRAYRVLTEKKAAEKDPSFKTHEKNEA